MFDENWGEDCEDCQDEDCQAARPKYIRDLVLHAEVLALHPVSSGTNIESLGAKFVQTVLSPKQMYILRKVSERLGHGSRRRASLSAESPISLPLRAMTENVKTNIPGGLPSALATARIIDDLSRVPYPENVKSPKFELNISAKDGKFRYDRDFLLQFMPICKEKPDLRPPLHVIDIGLFDENSMARTTKLRGGTHRPDGTTVSNVPGANNSPGFPGFNAKAPPFGMGKFGAGAKLSSEERYNSSLRAASGSVLPPFGRLVAHVSSQPSVSSGLSSSEQFETRDENTSAPPSHTASGFGGHNSSDFEEPLPLQVTANRWDRNTAAVVDPYSPEIVDRKVKGLLNKLDMEKFDSISYQIIEWVNKSEKETDGRTLIQVVRLVFEIATDDERWSEMYARLCRKMMEQISPKVQDDGIKNAEGKPIAGAQLFLKYLLNQCQDNFERRWIAKEAGGVATAKAANEKPTEADTSCKVNEIVLYSDEYYAAQKAKRQGLGLIKFIGELFKLCMLTERIMHECVKKLLGNVENPEEGGIESLCKLISTVGLLLDTPKARAHMDVYFSRMKELAKSSNVSLRMQFILQDVIELPYRAGGSRRGTGRGEYPGPGPDGWNAAGGNTPRPPPKARDFSNFGKIGSNSKGLPMTFGPSSVFSGKKDNKRESLSRTSLSSSMFSMLSETAEASADASQAAALELPVQRRQLVLQPRPKPTAEATPAGSAENSEEGKEEAAGMSVKDAEDSKEFFAIRKKV
ncbi:ARM repeat-containing protein [Mycena metata]|uniref:ARM repeat-containing protein n=1 Tax=Mycena metata TaxID=1033252 RepID=A0AAD7P0H5_9AGAR|nr:ARM repeat-containing protein [Mycena metata]